MEGWPSIMFSLLDGAQSVQGVLYMLVLVLVAGWLLSNLALAVMYEQVLVNQKKQISEKQLLDKIDLERRARAAAANFGVRVVFLKNARIKQGAAQAASTADMMTDAPQGKRLKAKGKRLKATLKEKWAQLQKGCSRLIKQQWFIKLFPILIVLNTIVMCIVFDDMPLQLCQTLEWLAFFFTICFIVEMMVKVIGLSILGYISDPFNVFDGVVVIFGVLEFVLSVATNSPLIPDECHGELNLSVLRALRMIKILFAIPR
eukprot:5212832-Prymnesium_polylepis.1